METNKKLLYMAQEALKMAGIKIISSGFYNFEVISYGDKSQGKGGTYKEEKFIPNNDKIGSHQKESPNMFSGEMFSEKGGSSSEKRFKTSSGFKPGYCRYFEIETPIFETKKVETTKEEKTKSIQEEGEVKEFTSTPEKVGVIVCYLLAVEASISLTEKNTYKWFLSIHPQTDNWIDFLPEGNSILDVESVLEILKPETSPLVRGFQRIKEHSQLVLRVKNLNISWQTKMLSGVKTRIDKTYVEEVELVQKTRQPDREVAPANFMALRGHFSHNKNLTIEQVTETLAKETYSKLRETAKKELPEVTELNILIFCQERITEFLTTSNFAPNDIDAIVAAKVLSKVMKLISTRSLSKVKSVANSAEKRTTKK